MHLHLRLWTKRLKQRMRLYFFPDNFVKRGLSKDDNDVVDSVSCCLNKMFGIFLVRNKPRAHFMGSVPSERLYKYIKLD